MKNNQSLLSQVLAPVPTYNRAPATHYLVPTTSDGWTFLRKELDAHLISSVFAKPLLGLTTLDLFELSTLLPKEPVNLLITIRQKCLLTDYACACWQHAYDTNDHRREHAYDALLDELMEHATAIRFFL